MALALTAATLVVGVEIKGARRWISIAGNRIQPSEFLKPCFAMPRRGCWRGRGRPASRAC